MRTFNLVAAKAPDLLAIRDGNKFFARTPYGEDTPIPWEGESPDMMIAALVSKWDFTPVVGPNGEPQPQILEDEAAEIKADKIDGADVWRVVEIFKMNEA